MGVPALKQLVREVKDSLDNGPRHVHVGMPSLFKKQGKRINKMREEFKQMDRDGAKRANAEAKKLGRDKPHDLKKDKHPEGAGDKDFRDHAVDEILDNVGKALKDLKGKGDLDEKIKDAAKELVRGLNSPDAKLKLLRTYALALKGELAGKAEGAAIGAVAEALYTVYLDGTPAAEAVDRDTFGKYLENGVGLAKKGKDLPTPIEGHTF